MACNLTPRIVSYLGSEEGLVREAYLDSSRIWSWAMGLATTGGFDVLRYKDKPATLVECLRASVTYIRTRYLPVVERAFSGIDLSEAQLAAALSFHWNTGAILTATWVKDVLAGKPNSAKADIMNWTSHGTLTARRQRERDLFFNGVWPRSLWVPVYEVAKPSYRPNRPAPVDVTPLLQQIMVGA